MQDFERYRQFADTLTEAAHNADPETYELLLQTAASWQALARTARGPAGSPTGRDDAKVVDFARAARRLRPPTR